MRSTISRRGRGHISGERLILYLFLFFVLSTAVLGATKPIAGYIFKTDGTTAAENASVRVYVNQASVSAANPCYSNPAVLSGSDGSWSTNLANLKRADNGNDCSGFWATGDAIWATAIGQNVSPEHGNGTTSNTTIASGSGLQYLSNVTLPPGPDRVAPVIHLKSPINYTNNTNGVIMFQYNVTDESAIGNCSLLFNGTINMTNTSVSLNITQNFSLTNILDGHYNWSVGCYDNVTNYNTSVEIFFLNVSKIGRYNLTLVTPNANVSVEQNQFFNFTMQVRCVDGSCGNTNASLDPIVISEEEGENDGPHVRKSGWERASSIRDADETIWDTLWRFITKFFSGNLITGQVAGALVPTTPTTPFYTNMSNPMNLSNVSCLGTMTQNSACNVTWYVNATGSVGTTAEFWAFANSTLYLSVKNESPHVFVTIIESLAPTVFGYIPNGETFNVTQVIEIGVNSTDAQNISIVKANVTYPNATVDLLTLSRVGVTNKFNVSYTVPPRTGLYVVRFWVNDTGGNINGSVYTNFTGVDVISPNVTTLLPTVGSTYNTSQVIQVSANATDVTNVSTVLATITYPNGTLSNVSLTRQGTTYKYNGTFTAPNRLGLYNITFFGNDSKNNINNSERTNFTILDGEYPRLSTIVEAPADPATYVYNQTYYFNITITDNIGIYNAIMQFNGTNYTNSIRNQSTTFMFNISDLAVAMYNYIWYANDTSGYINSTSSTYTVNRATSIVNLTLAGNDSDVNVSVGSVVNLSGYRMVGEGQIELLSNGSVFGLGNSSVSSNQSYSALGSYNITVRYNQTENYTSSQEMHILNVKDYLTPNVTLLTVNATDVNQTQHVRINATIIDNLQLDMIRTQIWFPNGSVQNFSMNNVSSSYNTTYITIITSNIGNHTAQILANDTSGNRNVTQNVSFFVYDVTPPSVVSLVPLSMSTVYANTVIELASNVTDNVAVSYVVVNLTYPNGTIQRISFSLGSGAKYNTSFSIGSSNGTYTMRVIANDSSNNINITELTSFFVNATDNSPVASIILPSDGYTNTTLTHIEMNFSCSATDDYSLRNVSLYLTNSVNTSLGLNQSVLLNGTINSTSWLVNISQGSFSWNCLAKDNSSQIDWAVNRSMVISAPSSSSSSSSGGGGGGGGGSSSSSGSGGENPMPVPVEVLPRLESSLGCLWNESEVTGNCVFNDTKWALNFSHHSRGAKGSTDSIAELVGRVFNVDIFNVDINLLGIDFRLSYLSLMVLLLGLLLLLLWRRKRPYLIITAPSRIVAGETLEMQVKVANDQNAATLRMWGLFVPDTGAGIGNIRTVMQRGETYKMDADSLEVRRGVIPITIPVKFAPGPYKIITCVRWEYGTGLVRDDEKVRKRVGSDSTGSKKAKITAYMHRVQVVGSGFVLPNIVRLIHNSRVRLPDSLALSLHTMREKLGGDAVSIELARSRKEILLRMKLAEKMHALRLEKLRVEEDIRHVQEEGEWELKLNSIEAREKIQSKRRK